MSAIYDCIQHRLGGGAQGGGVSHQSDGVIWRPYALRHAYAGRLWRHGGAQLDLFVAAGTMGHTVNEHVKTYRAHIAPVQLSRHAAAAFGEDYIARAERAVKASGSGRPQVPSQEPSMTSRQQA